MVRTVSHGGIRLCACAFLLVASMLSVHRASAQESLAEPSITAISAIVIDATTGEVLYDRDSHLRLPPASLTKIFTALLALESAPLDTRMTVSDDDLVGEASMGLVGGENLALETLLYGLLLPSGNDAAVAIARNLAGSSEAFVDRANARITELGLSDTALINPHGLDAHLHYSSARDLAAATLFALRTQPDFARISGALDHTAEGHELYQTNDLHVTYPGLIAGKTGVTDEAGFCLMEVAERNGQRVITVLLGSTPDAWYADAEILLDFGFATLATPGRLPATDVISIGNPVPATVENATTTQSNASTIAQPQSQIQPSTSLQVVPVGQNTALVNEPAIADAARRSPWLWLMLPVIAVPAMLFALLQASQIATRGSRRTRRAADSALSVPEAVSRSISPWETAQFTEVPSRPAPSSARYATPLHEDDDSDLHLIWDRATRERLLRGRPALNVSIGD